MHMYRLCAYHTAVALKSEPYQNNMYCLVPNSKTTQCISVTKISLLMPFSETITVYSEYRTNSIVTLTLLVRCRVTERYSRWYILLHIRIPR
jgi:hypothetical protein